MSKPNDATKKIETAIFDEQTAVIKVEETFAGVLTALPDSERDKYKMGGIVLHFTGVRRLLQGMNGWLGLGYLAEFGDHVRTDLNTLFL